MKQKIVTVLLCAAAAGCLVTGCGKTASEVTIKKTKTESEAEETAAQDLAEKESELSSATEISYEENTEEEETAENTEPETEGVREYPEYTALDYVELGDYSNPEFPIAEEVEVTDEEIDSYIREKLLDGYTTEKTEGTVAEGDIVNIDYIGKIDGKQFDGGSAEGYFLEIGSDTFIEGFEDGLIGAEIGKETTLEITFPDDYTEELAGKEASFEVTVNYVNEVPELTDELASELSSGVKQTAEEYRTFVRQVLEADEETSREEEQESLILSAVQELGTVKEIPEELLTYYEEVMIATCKSYADAYGIDADEYMEAYMGVTMEEFKQDIEEYAAEDLPTEMILQAIAEQEGIEVTEEDYGNTLEQYTIDYGYDTEEDMLKDYGESMVRHISLMDKTLEYLTLRSNVVEEFYSSSVGEETEAGTSESQDKSETEMAAEQ